MSEQWWVNKWKEQGGEAHPPQKVVWKDPRKQDKNVNICAVERARKRIGEKAIYSLLPTCFDDDKMNCESYVRWCYQGVYRSSQAENFTGGAHMGAGSNILSLIAVTANAVGALFHVDRDMVIFVIAICIYHYLF